MPRVVITPQDIRNGAIVIREPRTLHHLMTVLRVDEGDRVECVDGGGRWYATRVAARARGELVLDILEQGRESPPALSVWLMPALIKPERFDWLIQKTTELGVDRLTPIVTARSTVRVSSERAEARVARWRRIATEAAQQCGRATVPRLDAPVAFQDAVIQLGSGFRVLGSGQKNPHPPTQNPEPVLLPTLAVAGRPLREALAQQPALASAAIMIGPEGDFTRDEVALAQRHGAVPVWLGRRVLRSETAAIIVLAVLQHTAGAL